MHKRTCFNLNALRPKLALLPVLPLFIILLAAAGCAQPKAVIYVTATPQKPLIIGTNATPTMPNPFLPTFTPSGPTATPILPTPNPTVPPAPNNPIQYTIQAGDTIGALAASYGTDQDSIFALNPAISPTSAIMPGQTILMPGKPSHTTPNVKLIPDSELVNSPAVKDFDVEAYIRFQPGFIRVYSETFAGRLMSGAEIIDFYAHATSINPRLLLALLEYRGGWITNPVPDSDAMTYPLGYRDDKVGGLFKQLQRATDQLNAAYYGWTQRGLRNLQFPNNPKAFPGAQRLAYAPELNGGTVAVQYYLAQTAADRTTWDQDVSTAGFFTTYLSLFGDPFRSALEPLIPRDLKQPTLALPFAQGETWFYTAGPHGGWDAYGSGYAAIDLAPPRPPDDVLAAQGTCYISTYFVRSMAPGLVVRSGDGVVVVDLDMDGDERTGWTLSYLHIADQDRIKAGTVVQAGTQLGHPSCEGFDLSATATHVHIARRYNGVWISADCQACLPSNPEPPFVLGGWRVIGTTVYNGFLQNGGQKRTADQGRDATDNQITW